MSKNSEYKGIPRIVVVLAFVCLLLIIIGLMSSPSQSKSNIVFLGTYNSRVGDYSSAKMISYDEYLKYFSTTTALRSRGIFQNNSVVIIEVPYDSCESKDVKIGDFKAEENNYTINIEYTRDCNSCGIKYNYYALLNPNKIVGDFKVDFNYKTRNNIQCNNMDGE
jgi:hypothetical protein